MPTNHIIIDFLCAPGCRSCTDALHKIERIIHELDDKNIVLNKIDIVAQLDYAVALGLQASPGIAINGELVFTSLPTTVAILKAIESRQQCK